MIVHFDLAQDGMRMRGEGTLLALSETILCKQETYGRNLSSFLIVISGNKFLLLEILLVLLLKATIAQLV